MLDGTQEIRNKRRNDRESLHTTGRKEIHNERQNNRVAVHYRAPEIRNEQRNNRESPRTIERRKFAMSDGTIESRRA